MEEKKIEFGYSPLIDRDLRREIGIDSPWDDENIGAYLQILVEEINEKTPWDLRLQPWKQYGSQQFRVRIRKKESIEDSLVRQIQMLGLEKGKAIPAEDARRVLLETLGEHD